MAIEHDYFGIIDETASRRPRLGRHRRPRRPVGGDRAPGRRREPRSPSYALDAAAALIQALEGFDARARDALVAELSSRQSATVNYIDEQVEKLGETLLDLLVHNSGDIADRRAAVAAAAARRPPGRTTPRRRRCSRSSTTRSAPDETDALLTVSFDIRGDVVAVDTQG